VASIPAESLDCETPLVLGAQMGGILQEFPDLRPDGLIEEIVAGRCPIAGDEILALHREPPHKRQVQQERARQCVGHRRGGGAMHRPALVIECEQQQFLAKAQCLCHRVAHSGSIPSIVPSSAGAG